MKGFKVESSTLELIGFSEIKGAINKLGRCYVKFKNGNFYKYDNVPFEIFHEVMCAKTALGVVHGNSYGKAFNKLIKNKDEDFPCTKLKDSPFTKIALYYPLAKLGNLTSDIDAETLLIKDGFKRLAVSGRYGFAMC